MTINYSDFDKTKKCLMLSMPDVNFPLTFAQWCELPEQFKAAALYVSFYPAIVAGVCNYFAYSSAKEVRSDEIISAILCQLMQSIERIKKDSASYKYGLFYTIAIRATARVYRHKEYLWTYKMIDDPVIVYNDEYVDNFYGKSEIIPDPSDDWQNNALETVSRILNDLIIEDADIRIALRYLTGQQRKIRDRIHRKIPEILAELRSTLRPYADVFDIHLDCTTFEDVINNDELIDSAVVIMPDGTKAVYNHVKRVDGRGTIRYEFMGPEFDYVIVHKNALGLRVESVEPIE